MSHLSLASVSVDQCPAKSRVQQLPTDDRTALRLQLLLTDFAAQDELAVETYPDGEQQGAQRLLVSINSKQKLDDGRLLTHHFSHNCRLPQDADVKGTEASWKNKQLIVNVPRA